jgi:CheY-like chemotaxis protein
MTTILTVDDSLVSRKMLRHALQSASANPLTFLEASHGQGALALLASRDVDLLFTDLYMAGMDGLELVRRVRGEGRTLPVVVVTSERSETVLARLREAGADRVLSKPFQPEALKAVLDELSPCT